MDARRWRSRLWRPSRRIIALTCVSAIAVALLGAYIYFSVLPFHKLKAYFPRFKGRPVVALKHDGGGKAVPEVAANRVLIFMTYDASASRYGNVAAAVNSMYAKQWGFDFRVFREGHWPRNVRSQWGRYFVLDRLMRSGAADRYDLLVYVDADAFVVRPDIDVRRFAGDLARGEHIVFGNEFWVERWLLARAMARHALSPINSGAIVVRPGDAWARAFFKKMVHSPRWALCSRAKQRRIARYFDQACVDSLLREGLNDGVRYAYLQSREEGRRVLRSALDAAPLLYHVAGGVPSKGMWRAARTAKMRAVASAAWGAAAVAAAHKAAVAATDAFYLNLTLAEAAGAETGWRWNFGEKHALHPPRNDF